MDHNTFVRDIYSKYWIKAREHKYGFMAYDRNLCKLLIDNVRNPSVAGRRHLLEVAIGSGYPIADALQKAGFEIDGVELSPLLVERCREINSLVHAVVGDASCLQYPSNHFDAVYCFHSTWLFENLREGIGEMIRVVAVGGFVMFDIMNRDNEGVAVAYQKQLKEMTGTGWCWRQAKNIVKVITRLGYPMWRTIVHQVPTYPDDVNVFLRESECKNDIRTYVKLRDESIREVKHGESLSDFDRLIYIVKKDASSA